MSDEVTGKPIPTLDYAHVVPGLPPRRFGRVVVIFIVCLLLSWIVGAGTNAAASVVSLAYFADVVGWMYASPMTTWSCVREGLFESTFFGFGFAPIFTGVYIASTGTRCRLSLIFRAIGWIAAITLAGWITAGMAAAGWAYFSPTTFVNVFPLSGEVWPMAAFVRWAAVGGSIWGVIAGGAIGLSVGSIWMHFRWRRELQPC